MIDMWGINTFDDLYFKTGAIANIDEFLAACDDPNKPVHVIEIAVDGRLTEAVIARRAYTGFMHRFTTMRKKGKEKAYEVCFNGVGAPNTVATQYFKQELSGNVYVALRVSVHRSLGVIRKAKCVFHFQIDDSCVNSREVD